MATPNPFFAKWQLMLAEIDKEQLRDLLIDHHLYRQLQERVKQRSTELPESSALLFEWLQRGYVATAPTAIRRIAEMPKAGYPSISLAILLHELKANHTHLTRANFVQMYHLVKLPVGGQFQFRPVAVGVNDDLID